MTTNAHIEAAKLTDEEMRNIKAKVAWKDDMFLAIADAATAKALQIEDARRKALVEALKALLRLVQQGKYHTQDVEAAQAALKEEEAND